MNFYKNTLQILSRTFGTKFFLLLSVGTIVSLSSCDEASVVGLQVQPASDLLNVGFQDSTTLLTKTERIDSLQTDETLIADGTGLLGKFIDPVFGESDASIYTQVGLVSNNPNFGANPIVDSVVLSLNYSGIQFGDTSHKAQTVNVYQVTEDIIKSDNYYSDQTLNVASNDLTTGSGGYTFTPKPTTEVVVGTDTLSPRLRIPLEKNFGNLLVYNQQIGNLANSTTLQTFLKGLYITTANTSGLTSNQGNILHFNMGQSKITLYYHDSINKQYDLTLSGVGRFNHFNHNYSTGADASLAAQLSSTPSPTNDVVFLQSMSGVKTKIDMPYLQNWYDAGKVAINKAELVIKLNDSFTYHSNQFDTPTRLVLFGTTDQGGSYALPDIGEGDNYYGGSYNSTTKEYRFNIARYIQQVLTGVRHNNGLSLLTVGGSVNAYRVIVGGGKPGPYQMKLFITYTKLN